MKPLPVFASLFALVLAAGMASAQVIVTDQIRPIPIPRPVPPIPRPIVPDCSIRSVDVQTTIRDQVARVQISQIFKNTGSSTLEAQLLFPIPDEAAVSELTLLVDGKELAGKLMKKEDARRIYEEIVRKQRDPALLEYMGQGLYQTSVFPIPANAQRTVEIRYTQLLKKNNGLIDLLLPLGTARHSGKPIETFNVTVNIEAAAAIKTVYSPTHSVDIQRPDNTHAVAKLSLKDVAGPNDLRLLYSTEASPVGMNVVSFRPDKNDAGYFVLLAAPEVKAADATPVEKSIIFVVDRSGSMSGEKMNQAREALKTLIGRLSKGDTFNIVAYDSSVESFKPELQKVDEATINAALGYAGGLVAGGSTNIDGALKTALGMLVDQSRPSYILFFTDGLPTTGETRELQIAANAKEANKVNARLFNFGVGYDVNSRLLDRLARDGRGMSIYVRPNENIETHVAALYDKIGSPMLTKLAVNFEFDSPAQPGSPEVIFQAYPKVMPDLFHGDQLVWVGRYRKAGTVKVTLTGTQGSETKTFTASATLEEHSATETNGFVEKLWATRRIGEIIDELDLKGQNKELVDELVQLSTKHGILTPYTSFLADESVRLEALKMNETRAFGLSRRLDESSGAGGFAQRRAKADFQNKSAAPTSAPEQIVSDFEGNDVRITTVRNVGQKAFFYKENRWRDSTVTEEQEKNPTRITQFSKEYFDLAASNGGELAKYVAFDEPVLVNLNGITYQIDPPNE